MLKSLVDGHTRAHTHTHTRTHAHPHHQETTYQSACSYIPKEHHSTIYGLENFKAHINKINELDFKAHINKINELDMY
jgi:hypothetical protein